MNRNQRFLIFATVIFLLAPLLVFGLGKVEYARALFSNMHAANILLRVEREIMQKSPAGQYYESMFWKHNDEIMQIMSAHPEREDDFLRVARSFIPGLEALLNGEGDTVEITAGQVSDLKALLDWLASVGSPSLKEDIEREQARFPLDLFVGMSMDEALEYITTHWEYESSVPPMLVPDSNGEWAYTMLNGVYLEYPASYSMQQSVSFPDMVYFIPSPNVPEAWDAAVIKVHIWSLPPEQRDLFGPARFGPADDLAWQNEIVSGDFTGVQFLFENENIACAYFGAFLYNKQTQTAIDIWILAEPIRIQEFENFQDVINQKYPYLQHLIEKIGGNLQP
ncbi:MAG: hypothetical protein FD146_2374 [Anaerolineaceae bacterium]|nr:MAG: hypothetical protein FD146_2374 [Anaerolineaceae bacterium]